MLQRLFARLPILGLALYVGAAQSQAINYNFSWTASGSLSQTFTNATFGLSITGTTDGAYSFSPPGGGTAYINTGVPDGVAGGFSGSLTGPAGIGDRAPSQPFGVFTDLGLVSGVRQNVGVGFAQYTGGSLGSELMVVDNRNFPGLAGYNLQSSFGPMGAGIGQSGGAFSLPLANSAQLNFTSIGNESFQAVASGNGAISYNFSWTGSGSLSQTFTNASFNLSIAGTTDSVYSISPPVGGTAYINTGVPEGVAGGLTGSLTGPADIGSLATQPFGVFTDLGLVGGVRQNVGVGFAQYTDATLGAELLVVDNLNFPGLAGYNLQSGFGPMSSGIGESSGPFSLSLANSAQLNFTSVSNEAFEAVTAVNAVPEPEIYAMMLAGLGMLGWAARRRKQEKSA